MHEKEKRRRLKTLTPRERQVLEILCRYEDLTLQQIVARRLIMKASGEPIKVGTLKSYNQKLYNKLAIKTRERKELEREYRLLVGDDELPARVEPAPEQAPPTESGSPQSAESPETGELQPVTSGKPEPRLMHRVLRVAALAALVLFVAAVLIVRFWSPTPIPCGDRELAETIFPQLDLIGSYLPFVDEEHDDVFTCEGVRDLDPNVPMAVHLSFNDPQGSDQYGYYGIGGFAGSDVSIYSELCLQVFAKEPGQRFWLKLKDTNAPKGGGGDIGREVVVGEVGGWVEQCVPLQYFAQQGLDLKKLENVNVAFDNTTGATEIWIGGIELRSADGAS